MTIREHEGEVHPRYFCFAPVKCLIDAVSDCSSWVITFSIACIILSPVILSKSNPSDNGDISTSAALGLFAAGMFGCAAGMACKVATCYVEDDDEYQPQAVEMV